MPGAFFVIAPFSLITNTKKKRNEVKCRVQKIIRLQMFETIFITKITFALSVAVYELFVIEMHATLTLTFRIVNAKSNDNAVVPFDSNSNICPNGHNLRHTAIHN